MSPRNTHFNLCASRVKGEVAGGVAVACPSLVCRVQLGSKLPLGSINHYYFPEIITLPKPRLRVPCHTPFISYMNISTRSTTKIIQIPTANTTRTEDVRQGRQESLSTAEAPNSGVLEHGGGRAKVRETAASCSLGVLMYNWYALLFQRPSI